MFELNERNNKNRFQSIWVAIAFQNDDTALPNNRFQALQGLKHLKNKFQRDPTFCSYYKQFMNTLMRNRYTKKSTSSATEGKCWYIPHNGVYNENKPNKIRIVFDSSTEYQGRSLNNELNYLRGKYNERSAAPLKSSIVLCILLWGSQQQYKSCYDGLVFQDAVCEECFSIGLRCLYL